MTTARQLIKDSLRKIHALGTGQTLDGDEANDALGVFNDMLSELSIEHAGVYQETKETFNLTGASSYTIAVGGDFNTESPLEIVSAFQTQGSTDYPLTQYGEKEYANIAQKDIEGFAGGIFYYDANYPTANLYLTPVPTTGTITLYSRKYLTGFTDLDTVYAFPAFYRNMLVYNGAVALSSEYEREASPTVQGIAKSSKRKVKAQNKKNNKPVSMLNTPSRGYSGGSTGKAILGGDY